MAGDIDKLDLSDLHGPLLDDYMKSQQLYADLHAIASQIRTNYVANVAVDTGALKSTAKVTMHRSKIFRDRRWEAEFSVGNSKVDYADDIEARDHTLQEVLRAMGWNVEIF